MSTITKRLEEVIMKKAIVFSVMMVVLLAANRLQADVCEIVNGSFEDDEYINDITSEEPNGWSVSVPSYWFGGGVWDDWATDGNYSLAFFSYDSGVYDANDTIMVSQEVCLTDVNMIVFDVMLDTSQNDPWDPNKRSAVLLIGDDVVWESNSVGSDVRDEYLNRIYLIEEEYKTPGLHELSLGLRVNVDEYYNNDIYYELRWDFIEFDPNCERFGYFAGDFNHDCCVDFLDFAMLADYWRDVNAPAKYDLYEDGIIDFNDLDVFVEGWLKSSYVEE